MAHGAGSSVLGSVEHHRPISPLCDILSKIRAWASVFRKDLGSPSPSLIKNKLLSPWSPTSTVNVRLGGSKMAARERDAHIPFPFPKDSNPTDADLPFSSPSVEGKSPYKPDPCVIRRSRSSF